MPFQQREQVMTEIIIRQTQHWVQTVVVGLNFCPFARREIESQRVRYSVIDSTKRKDVLEQFLDECYFLDEHPEIATTLLILPQGFSDFSTYLDMLEMAESLLAMEGYEGIYQVASFHPDYCFADAELDDPANYTNRSPYPILHLLREESLELAIDSHPNADDIPKANMVKARELGLAHLRDLLNRSKIE